MKNGWMARFIPTHVGQTQDCGGHRLRRHAVHPHACGADVSFDIVVFLADRFIPTHVGQTYDDCLRSALSARFIPTHVGQTLTVGVVELLLTVHPHACGADVQLVTVIVRKYIGSSPRMWGRLLDYNKIYIRPVGSSPRMWGRLPTRPMLSTRYAVHPHACGADCGSHVG